MQSLRVTAEVVVPSRALTVRTARSPGPGGQRVNKAETKVTVFFDPALCPDLPPGAWERLKEIAPGRIDRKGRLRVTSYRWRTQKENLKACRERLAELLRQALTEPRIRKKTAVPRRQKEKRRQWKQRHSLRKALRKPPACEE